MSSRLQLCAVWAGPVAVVLYLAFFAGVAGFVPPPSPHWTAQHVANFFAANHSSIRVGQLGAMISSTLFFPFFAVVSLQIARIEKRSPLLALTQFGCAVLLMVFFVLCSMLWVAASFRSDLSATTVRALNDLSWLCFVMVFPGYVMQMACVAIVSMRDRSADPVWPRWAGWLSAWTGLCGCGGGIAVFFKHGPFAWNGLIGFYVPFAEFVIWLGVMTYLMHGWIRRNASVIDAVDEPGVTVAAPGPPSPREPALA